jgi:hypothetical protein
LTISDNVDNFPTGFNNRGDYAPPAPSHGATADRFQVNMMLFLREKLLFLFIMYVGERQLK